MIFDRHREHEVQVRQQEVLVGRLLRVDRRAERGDGREVHARRQEKADIALDRLSVKEYEDPFSRGSQEEGLAPV